jgi:hypothetical protein
VRGYNLSGRVVLSAPGADPHDTAFLAGAMDPFEERDGVPEAPLVELRPDRLPPLVELHRPAGDGLVTGRDEQDLRLVSDGRSCTLPDVLAGDPAVFRYENGFPLGTVFKPFVRSALQLSALRADAVAVHAAAVEADGGAVLFAGWSESGKTELALAALERGARFISDKWTFVGRDQEASAFPIDVGVRGWVLRYAPRLRGSLPGAARTQLATARVGGRVLRPAIKRAPGRAGQAAAAGLGRALDLADRAPITASRLSEAYGQTLDGERRVRLRAVVLLTTVPDGPPTAATADPTWAARRLAQSAAYERRPYFGLAERARYAFPARPRKDLPDAVREREEELLAPVLAATTVIEARAPFPADPRAVHEAVARAL